MPVPLWLATVDACPFLLFRWPTQRILRRAQGFRDDTISDIVYHGSKKWGANIWRDDWGRYLREITLTEPPKGMYKPHAHHLGQKLGGGKAGATVRKILDDVGIDTYLSKHNLGWAPNAVKGQHGLKPQAQLLANLMKVTKTGTN